MAVQPGAHITNHVLNKHNGSSESTSATPDQSLCGALLVYPYLDMMKKKTRRTANRLCPTRRSCRSVFLIVALVVVLLETFAFYVILKTIQKDPKRLSRPLMQNSPIAAGFVQVGSSVGTAMANEHPMGALGQNLPIEAKANNSEISEPEVPEPPVENPAVIQTQPSKERRVKRILLWTYFWDRPDFYFGYGRDPFIWSQCDVTACETTSDRTLYDFSDAIVFHINNMTEDKPDLPAYRHQNQRWVYFNLEPPHQTRVSLDPYDGVFNITMTYRLDSDVKTPYGGFVDLTEEERKVVPDINYAEHKKKLAAWMASNCQANNKRELYVKDLKRFMSVDIYGGCGTLDCPRENHVQCLEMLRSDYKFYLAFENNLCEDYLSEMVWLSLQYDVVPVVMGGSDYAKHLPPGSYIDVKDFDSPENLANFLKTLDFDPIKYNSYFSWRKNYKLVFPYQKTFCYLCDYLNSQEHVVSKKDDLSKWHGLNTCKAPQDYYNKFASVYQ